jgi:predicted DsbA family dithiol-disulfide isomerase
LSDIFIKIPEGRDGGKTVSNRLSHRNAVRAHCQISQDTVDKIAESVGLDVNWLKQDMASPEILEALRANVALAHALNIHGTPGFIIGNHIVAGALSLDTLKEMIAAARKA